MKHLLLTTALVSLIAAAPLSAQTTNTAGDTAGDAAGTGTGTMFTPPEGYTAFESATLTVEDLQGATVYDANGESVGEISDFVFAGGGSSATATGTTAGGATDGTAGTDTTAMTDGTGATTDTGSDMAGDGGTAGTGDGTATSESMAETATDGTGTGNATDTTAGTGAGTDMTDTTGTDMAATEPQQEVDVTSGEISHVVLDVGGFLGMGTHAVAVPLDELQVFRDEGADLRIYLPWTQAQLEALPEFDENDPASLDATEQAPATGSGG
jgi:hypothetical protein